MQRSIRVACVAAFLILAAPVDAQLQPDASRSSAYGAAVTEMVGQFYAGNQTGTVWLSGAARDVATELLHAASDARQYGVCFPGGAPEQLLAELTEAGLLSHNIARDLDIRITDTLAAFLLQLGLGRHTVVTGETLSVRVLNVGSLLEQAAIGRPARDLLEVAQPRHPEYTALRRALAQYREASPWKPLPDDFVYFPERDPAEEVVQQLTDRLRSSGDFIPGDVEGSVRAFQTRHGLTVDGIVGPNTLRELNTPLESRIAQLAINLDRWRRLPDDLGDRHVRVNIPAFGLQLFDHGQPVLQMRTIVGTAANQTPVFSDRIRYLDFNPYWNVPRSIASEEITPRAAEDPGYLARQGFEVIEDWSEDAEAIDPYAVDWEAERFSYRLRQLPGPDNALGLVKFMFPNRYSVYLHDTPARHLFQFANRARSHGCVRVEQPAQLAAELLRETGEWPVERVEATLGGEDRQVVLLPSPVPVHLLYFTAWVDESGRVQFRDDIYGRDTRAADVIGCDWERSQG